MSRIEFHFNAPALVPYACRLLRKVHGRGLRAQVVGHRTTLVQLDQALWTFSSLDFLPHCGADAAPSMRSVSSVLLTEQPCADWDRQILINLGEPAEVRGTSESLVLQRGESVFATDGEGPFVIAGGDVFIATGGSPSA